MSEPKRASLTTLSTNKCDRKPVKNCRKTVRLDLDLKEPNEDSCSVFNFTALINAVEKKHLKRKQQQQRSGSEQRVNGSFLPEDPFLEDADDEDVRRIARQFEEKYGSSDAMGCDGNKSKSRKKSRCQTYAELGAGYDETDSFIDNTEACDEALPEELQTVHGGYYVNSGPLEFKRVELSDDTDFEEIKARRRKFGPNTIRDDSEEEEEEDEGEEADEEEDEDEEADEEDEEEEEEGDADKCENGEYGKKTSSVEERVPLLVNAASGTSEREGGELMEVVDEEDGAAQLKKMKTDKSASADEEAKAGDVEEERPPSSSHITKKRKKHEERHRHQPAVAVAPAVVNHHNNNAAISDNNNNNGEVQQQGGGAGVHFGPPLASSSSSDTPRTPSHLHPPEGVLSSKHHSKKKSLTVKELLEEKRVQLNMHETAPPTASASTSDAAAAVDAGSGVSIDALNNSCGPGKKDVKNHKSVNDVIEYVVSSGRDEESSKDSLQFDSELSRSGNSSDSQGAAVVGSQQASIITPLAYVAQQPAPAPTAAVPVVEVPDLPEGLPSDLVELISLIKVSVNRTEFTRRSFSGEVNAMLISLEKKMQNLHVVARNVVYEHLSCFVPCSKFTLIKRMKKLCVDLEEEKMIEPLRKLKAAIDLAMPALLEKHFKECQKIASEKSGDEPSTAGDPSSFTGEDGKGGSPDSKMPRRKFVWTEEMRTYVNQLVRLRQQCYLIKNPRRETKESFLQSFFESKVVPLWPPGWMKTSTLCREAAAPAPAPAPAPTHTHSHLDTAAAAAGTAQVLRRIRKLPSQQHQQQPVALQQLLNVSLPSSTTLTPTNGAAVSNFKLQADHGGPAPAHHPPRQRKSIITSPTPSPAPCPPAEPATGGGVTVSRVVASAGSPSPSPPKRQPSVSPGNGIGSSNGVTTFTVKSITLNGGSAMPLTANSCSSPSPSKKTSSSGKEKRHIEEQWNHRPATAINCSGINSNNKNGAVLDLSASCLSSSRTLECNTAAGKHQAKSTSVIKNNNNNNNSSVVGNNERTGGVSSGSVSAQRNLSTSVSASSLDPPAAAGSVEERTTAASSTATSTEQLLRPATLSSSSSVSAAATGLKSTAVVPAPPSNIGTAGPGPGPAQHHQISTISSSSTPVRSLKQRILQDAAAAAVVMSVAEPPSLPCGGRGGQTSPIKYVEKSPHEQQRPPSPGGSASSDVGPRPRKKIKLETISPETTPLVNPVEVKKEVKKEEPLSQQPVVAAVVEVKVEPPQPVREMAADVNVMETVTAVDLFSQLISDNLLGGPPHHEEEVVVTDRGAGEVAGPRQQRSQSGGGDQEACVKTQMAVDQVIQDLAMLRQMSSGGVDDILHKDNNLSLKRQPSPSLLSNSSSNFSSTAGDEVKRPPRHEEASSTSSHSVSSYQNEFCKHLLQKEPSQQSTLPPAAETEPPPLSPESPAAAQREKVSPSRNNSLLQLLTTSNGRGAGAVSGIKGDVPDSDVIPSKYSPPTSKHPPHSSSASAALSPSVHPVQEKEQGRDTPRQVYHRDQGQSSQAGPSRHHHHHLPTSSPGVIQPLPSSRIHHSSSTSSSSSSSTPTSTTPYYQQHHHHRHQHHQHQHHHHRHHQQQQQHNSSISSNSHQHRRPHHHHHHHHDRKPAAAPSSSPYGKSPEKDQSPPSPYDWWLKTKGADRSSPPPHHQ